MYVIMYTTVSLANFVPNLLPFPPLLIIHTTTNYYYYYYYYSLSLTIMT